MIAIAQLEVTDAGVNENLQRHLHFIRQAKKLGAQLVLFPELSLHGYVLEQAFELSRSELSAHANAQLHKLSLDLGLITVIGAFTFDGDQTYISSLICGEGSGIRVYQKQHLHEGEGLFVSPGNSNAFIMLNNVKFALGICADFAQPNFYRKTKDEGAEVLLFSVLISKNGFQNDKPLLEANAAEMPILFSNLIGTSGHWMCGGRSGFMAGTEFDFLPAAREGLMLLRIERLCNRVCLSRVHGPRAR